MWQQAKRFKAIVKKAWEESSSNENRMEVIKEKLKVLKWEIKQSDEEVFNMSKIREQHLLAKIEQIDQREDDGYLRKDMRVRQMELLSEIRCLAERELAILWHKSRVE